MEQRFEERDHGGHAGGPRTTGLGGSVAVMPLAGASMPSGQLMVRPSAVGHPPLRQYGTALPVRSTPPGAARSNQAKGASVCGACGAPRLQCMTKQIWI